MKTLFVPAAVLLASLAVAQPRPSVRYKDGLLDVQSKDAKLTEILDEIARLAHLTVSYDPQAPRPLVSVSIERRPLEDALHTLLGAQKLRYVITHDPTGKIPAAVMVLAPEGTGPAALSPEEWVKKHVKPGQPASPAAGTTALPPGMTMTDPSKVGSPPKPSSASPKPGESQPLPPGMRPAGDPLPGSKPPDPRILMKPVPSPAASPAAKPTPSPSPTPTPNPA